MLLTTESGSCYFPATALLRLYAALRGIAGKANIVVYCHYCVTVLRIHDIFARIRIRGYAALRGIVGKANIIVFLYSSVADP
jgi:hypothetical protein